MQNSATGCVWEPGCRKAPECFPWEERGGKTKLFIHYRKNQSSISWENWKMWYYIKLGVNVNQELITFCKQLTCRCSEPHKETGICEVTTALQNLCYCLLHFSVIHAFYFLQRRPRENKILLHWRVTTSSILWLRWLVHVASLRLHREIQVWRLLFVFSVRMHEF